METIRIFVVDDHPMYRNGVHTLLDSLAELEWIGEASTGEEAIELVLELQPDVILMDIQLPTLNGIEATRRILHQSPHINILMLTMHKDDDMVFAAMQAGASGYLLKGAGQDEIIRAIHAASNGEAIFSSGIAQRLMAHFSAPRIDQVPLPEFPKLTQREHEILELIASGYNNPEIATRLVLSDKTVRNHVSNILSKLQVADRANAIIRAREAGLGRTE